MVADSSPIYVAFKRFIFFLPRARALLGIFLEPDPVISNLGSHSARQLFNQRPRVITRLLSRYDISVHVIDILPRYNLPRLLNPKLFVRLHVILDTPSTLLKVPWLIMLYSDLVG